MGEETSDTMNLDLNLGPGPEVGSGSVPSEDVNLDEWIDDPFRRLRESVRISRVRQRWRRRQAQIPETHPLSVQLSQLIENSDSESNLQAGEGSVAAEERTDEAPKMCENNNGFLEDEVSEKNGGDENRSKNDGSFFDCNICLDLATDPVVTCCGHLFCWSCLYRWLHAHSDANECPVCKGEVTVKNVTPIYGRGNNTRQPDEDSSLEVPVRPCARRVESWRQSMQRNSFSFPMEEMIRRLGSRFDLTRDLNPVQDSNGIREIGDRASFLSRIMTLRGMRTEQSPVAPIDNIVDLTQSGTSSSDARSARRLHSLLLRRSQSHSQRLSTDTSNSAALNSTERLIEAYFRNHSLGRNQDQPQPVDDRDSFSSITAVINSESQIDTAVEIDSMGSLLNSSRRRNDTARVSDVDSGDSRAPRRRRFN
ncbi:uncharacterized protein LOC110620724 [Manihot esculenta]|uniref:Uncharacterized protein n=6 Tax=Manihot esculenta TaxID=3983 RepID=A0ACB7HA67_MANES|nr:uncharacterized protein LOC110620724 [Manihot esculenta]XP_021620244.1 uncharacterized protein LOC110620724 [Manihot esculenta]XP_021620245.1 uncharacterized protein LOC110620724 [Manihot esculenta]XP_043814897.1 uncharacterized protein LOC110620724 [Manihot esculenta]KAG8648838.1 hypothetical protein MANES_08G043800v8 [Manihot esculenta]KAG8648839.1 hypothetical protein MANES_08G043800v8 [Manihot esculenta]KAG8648840.1 hypothetical protein MANES_08G043800v8 [Manihot esculenta]KAG8648841.